MQHPDVSFRHVKEEDFPAIERLFRKRATDFKPAWDAKRTQKQLRLLRERKLNAIIAIEDRTNRLVGYSSYSANQEFIGAYLREHHLDDKVIELNLKRGLLFVAAVDPEYKGRRVGLGIRVFALRDLMNKGIDIAYFIRHSRNFSGFAIDGWTGAKTIAKIDDAWRGEEGIRTVLKAKGLTLAGKIAVRKFFRHQRSVQRRHQEHKAQKRIATKRMQRTLIK